MRVKPKKQVSFETTEVENKAIRKITKRVARIRRDAVKAKLLPESFDDVTTIVMDVVAAHCNGCPLKLEDLLDASDFNFIHDVFGINEHMDRKTGRLLHHFLPRFAVKAKKAGVK